jgi:predicted ATPase
MLRTLRCNFPTQRTEFPFSIPAFAHLEELDFHPDVTFFVGENGSGKSTLLEAIAQLAGMPATGGSSNFTQVGAKPTPLMQRMRLARGTRRPTTAYFLRAESFFNVATEIDNIDLERVGLLDSYGGTSLHAQSHGESFLSLANHRFGPGGLYILDEPEAALSPQRQLAFLAIMHHLVQTKSQFVIATHSPILMAFPSSKILHFSSAGIEEIAYEKTEHFALTLDFLQHRQRYLDRLCAAPKADDVKDDD